MLKLYQYPVLAGFLLIVAVALSGAGVASAQPAPSGDPVERQRLAEQYISLTNRWELTAETYKKQLTALSVCNGKSCSSDFDRAISETLAEIGPEYRRRMAKLYADHLTEVQLRAAVEFASSPAGRSIAEVSQSMTAEAAEVGNAFWKDVSGGVSRRFCAVQNSICFPTSSDPDPDKGQKH